MKKFSILALALVICASLLTGCTGTMTDESTGPSGSTGPSSATSPSTTPTTAPTTVPTVPATAPTATDPSKGTDPTEATGGVNTLDPTGNGDGKDGPKIPGMG